MADNGTARAAAIHTLIDAAQRGDEPVVASLLDAHPDIINARGGSGTRTALHVAAIGGRAPLVALLLDRGANPNIRCEGDEATPLHFAAEKERLDIIQLLIERAADPIGAGDDHELGIIGWATCFGSGRRDVVDYLLAHGAVHHIFSAVATGDTDAIRQIVSRSPADLDARMDIANRRRRPLHLAVEKRQPASLATLLELGAKVDTLDAAGMTALDHAALAGQTEMAHVLIDRGADIRLPAAVALGRTADIDRLLHEEPDALKPGQRWGTLIVRASEHAPGHVIDALIGGGASVNVHDETRTSIDGAAGYTALHAAAFFGNLDAATALLRHGANVHTRDSRYDGTPSGWANYAGHTIVRDLIQSHERDAAPS